LSAKRLSAKRPHTELDMTVCPKWLHDNSATRSTGAEVAGSANSAAQYLV